MALFVQQNQNHNMRNLFKCILLLLLFTLMGTVAIAQNPDNPFEPGTTVEKVFSWYTAIYGAAVILLTRLQAAFFPKAGSVPRIAVRYILIAAVVGGLFIALGVTNAWGVVAGFLGSALTYDKVLEPLGFKTPTPK